MPAALNCAAPDTGNMEVLSLFGSEQQRKEWLEPLLERRVRSSFAMSEHDVATCGGACSLTAHFTTVRFDNPGGGRTGTGAERPYSVEQMALDARAVLHAAGFARAAVFGVSMGGRRRDHYGWYDVDALRDRLYSISS